MGMFDYLTISCPNCRYVIENQTKAFDCSLSTIDLDKPQSPGVVECFEGDDFICPECGTIFKLSSHQIDKIQMTKKIIGVSDGLL